MTTIAVIGNGRVGGNLATALTRAGHEVTVADRTPGAAADAARTARRRSLARCRTRRRGLVRWTRASAEAVRACGHTA
ncbi:NAD(P)-binding domain-containing protein [Kitasatospora azatica]|uniref:NAD(P)-binding domain-containing protein n=1 Tax=Kitasatospora azatica TaxID=58347 RepID=UPI0022771C72|nr:NAD(P)-binding domain-containing protein [Kitasatospora azatica]